MKKYDVAIIGGGLAGLAAANYLSREGKRVVLIEKSNRLGGRSLTNLKNGFHLNLGGRALYRDGEAYKFLTDLGIEINGESALTKIFGLMNRNLHLIPADPLSILSSSLLSWKEKYEYTKLMYTIKKQKFNGMERVSLKEWAEKNIKSPLCRHIFFALCRTLTYIANPNTQLAQPVLRQFQHSLNGGVIYVDGGWGTIIEQLKSRAIANGVEILENHPLTQIETNSDFQTIQLLNDVRLQSSNCILAVSPDEVLKLMKDSEQCLIHNWKEQMMRVTCSCLDIGLNKLPNQNVEFVVGIDQPIYLSHQSRSAKVCDKDKAVINIISYHQVGIEIDPQQEKQKMEKLMDSLQPGWRDEVVVQQFLPNMTVTYDFPQVNQNQIQESYSKELPGIYFAGDWTYHEELLSDAAVASARRAALAILKKEKVLVEG